MEFNGNTNRPHLRLIGDVHGYWKPYLALANEAEHSIQVGDLGFDYKNLASLDSAKHKVLGGNHDNYELSEGRFVKQTPHFLGDFGVYAIPDFGDIFFVRGGNSIDKEDRYPGINWWPSEQLSYADGGRAIEEYKRIKPDFVISHECPVVVLDSISKTTGVKTWNGIPIRPSLTAQLLQAMWDEHKPITWVFGHHHRDFAVSIGGTNFRCLKGAVEKDQTLGYVDLPRFGEAIVVGDHKGE